MTVLKYDLLESQSWSRCPPTCVVQGVAPNSNLPGATLILYLNLLTHISFLLLTWYMSCFHLHVESSSFDLCCKLNDFNRLQRSLPQVPDAKACLLSNLWTNQPQVFPFFTAQRIAPVRWRMRIATYHQRQSPASTTASIYLSREISVASCTRASGLNVLGWQVFPLFIIDVFKHYSTSQCTLFTLNLWLSHLFP